MSLATQADTRDAHVGKLEWHLEMLHRPTISTEQAVDEVVVAMFPIVSAGVRLSPRLAELPDRTWGYGYLQVVRAVGNSLPPYGSIIHISR